MKSKITKDEIIALAKLTKLRLSDDEVEQYTNEISELLTYFEQLDKLDLKDVEPTISVGATHSVTRADEVREQVTTPDELMNLPPKKQDDFVQVERMI